MNISNGNLNGWRIRTKLNEKYFGWHLYEFTYFFANTFFACCNRIILTLMPKITIENEKKKKLKINVRIRSSSRFGFIQLLCFSFSFFLFLLTVQPKSEAVSFTVAKFKATVNWFLLRFKLNANKKLDFYFGIGKRKLSKTRRYAMTWLGN